MLAVTIDAAVALLQTVGVPRNLIVDEAVAVALEIDTFAGRIRSEQDADRRVLGVVLERRLGALAILRILRAVQEFYPAIGNETAVRENTMKPLLGVPIFRENDHAFAVPLSLRPQISLYPREQLVGLRIKGGGGARSPFLELVQDRCLSLGDWSKGPVLLRLEPPERLPASSVSSL